MTNTQQIVLDEEVCEIEQSQEEIQLTELLPVEQSRIENNPDNKDTTTTDGLKALRSFAQSNQNDFDSRNFKVFGKLSDYEFVSKDNNDDIVISRQEKRKDWHLDHNDNDGIRSLDDVDIDTDDNNLIDSENPSFENSDSVIFANQNNGKYKRKLRKSGEDKDNGFFSEKQSNRMKRGRKRKRKEGDDLLKDEIFCYQEEGNNSDDGGISEEEHSNEDGYGTGSVSENTSTDVFNVNINDDDDDDDDDQNNKKSKSKKNTRRKRVSGTEKGKELVREDDNMVQENNNVNNERDNNNADDNADKQINGATETLNNLSKSLSRNDSKNYQQGKKYCCLKCDAKFKGSGGLRNHWKVVHSRGPLFKCDDCGKEFPLKERLKLHVRIHTGFKPYKCSECDKSFARGGQLAQHRRTHSHIKPYHCALCSGTFTCSANLALHMKRHNGQKDHKCDICGKGFFRRDALKKHLECLHKDVKSFLCIICNKTFKGHLPQHMRTHCQDRPHGCATCGQRFAQKSQLTVHQRTHSGQRPFRCLVCWQAFAHSTALKLHTRRHTGERPFKCTECNAEFTQLPHWKKHMKCIHGRSEPYSCKNCNLFFRIKIDLENHEKNCLKSSDSVDEFGSSNSTEAIKDSAKFRAMNIEKMRLLLAVLLKRISKPEKLVELGFGKRLIDQVLQESLISAGKDPAKVGELTEFEALRKNLETFLEWTVPKEHWEIFKKMNKSAEEILETLTTT